MNDPLVGVKDIIEQVRYIASVLGSEATDGLATTREYCDPVLFILIDESNERVWVSIPVKEENEDPIWKAVLDVPEDGFPEHFLTNVTPENGDLAWVDYLDVLQAWIEEHAKTAETLATHRYLRRLFGDHRVDTNALISDLVRLRRMGLKSAMPLLSLLHRLLEIEPEHRTHMVELIGV